MNRAYYGWLAGASLSTFGDAALFFALGWAATAISPGVAGAVLTGFTLPRTVLLLAGGVLGDRWGPRRVLLTCYLMLTGITLTLALFVHWSGTSVLLLLVTALIIGTLDAFTIPAAGSFPRLFARDDELARALALRGSTTQLINLLSGPASGLLVAVVGLAGALLLDATTFAVAAVVLLVVKPPFAPEPEPVRRSVVREAADGIRVAWGDPVLRPLLLAVSLVAGFVLPVASLCVPLLVRAQGWGAQGAGLVIGAAVAGGLVVTAAVARWGTVSRPGVAVAGGPLLAAVGMAGLALAPSVGVATACMAVQGIGVGLFTSHLAPIFVASTPPAYLTRLQSILALVQTAPLLVSTNLLGLVAAAGAHFAVLVCAAGTGLAGVALLRTRQIHVRRSGVVVAN